MSGMCVAGWRRSSGWSIEDEGTVMVGQSTWSVADLGARQGHGIWSRGGNSEGIPPASLAGVVGGFPGNLLIVFLNFGILFSSYLSLSDKFLIIIIHIYVLYIPDLFLCIFCKFAEPSKNNINLRGRRGVAEVCNITLCLGGRVSNLRQSVIHSEILQQKVKISSF